VRSAKVARSAPTDKEQVAHRAADLVADGEVVLIDIGTTTARLAGSCAADGSP